MICFREIWYFIALMAQERPSAVFTAEMVNSFMPVLKTGVIEGEAFRSLLG